MGFVFTVPKNLLPILKHFFYYKHGYTKHKHGKTDIDEVRRQRNFMLKIVHCF
jgi:hypothetical protein